MVAGNNTPLHACVYRPLLTHLSSDRSLSGFCLSASVATAGRNTRVHMSLLGTVFRSVRSDLGVAGGPWSRSARLLQTLQLFIHPSHAQGPAFPIAPRLSPFCFKIHFK